jgi:hypothetical protein
LSATLVGKAKQPPPAVRDLCAKLPYCRSHTLNALVGVTRRPIRP